jgi:hypothetical protein
VDTLSRCAGYAERLAALNADVVSLARLGLSFDIGLYARQRNAGLALIFAAAVGVGKFALAIGFQKQKLADALVGEHACW